MMSSYEQHSTALTDEEFEREFGDGQTGEKELMPVSDAEEADSHNRHGGSSPPVGMLWGNFRQRKFADATPILFGMRRGNVGLLVAETDIGKTTLALNLSLILAANRTFPPFITERCGGLRVMYVDGESTRAELQADIARMMVGWSDEERALVDRNLLVLCEEEVEDQLLNLADRQHRALVMRAAQAFKPDLTVIDTMAALFNLGEENSNTEAKAVVMQPLKMLAKEANGAVLLAHHIGKPKSEEGSTSVHAYKGRGASNFGCLARSVVVLVGDKADKQRVVLSVPKAKGYCLPDTVMLLDDKARWFKVTDEQPPDKTTCLQAVVAFVTRGMKTAEIVEGLKGWYSRSAVEEALKDAVTRGQLRKPKHGWYEPPETTQTTFPYGECGSGEQSSYGAA